jgi:hypothetical protein
MTMPFGRWVAIVLLGLLAGQARGFVEDYRVNAQYRGSLKKGFQDLGTGKVSYQSLGSTAFRVHAAATVRHPKQSKQYTFDVDESFDVSGNVIHSTALVRDDMNENARPHERRIREVLPFAYLVRYLPPPSETGDPSRHFTYEGQSYTLRYRHTEKNIEAELFRGEVFLGKFFLLADAGWRPAAMEKFRIALPEEDLVASFIVTDPNAARSGQEAP